MCPNSTTTFRAAISYKNKKKKTSFNLWIMKEFFKELWSQMGTLEAALISAFRSHQNTFGLII